MEKQTLDAFVGIGFFDGVADDLKIVFVHDFVRLNVEAPVMRALRQGLVGLFAQDQAALGFRGVPKTVENFDFRGLQALDHLARVIVALSESNDELVDEWQKALDAFENGVAHELGISNYGKSTDRCRHEASSSSVLTQARQGEARR